MPENQVRALIRAAKREGVRIEVKIGDAVVTVFPDDHKPDDKPVAEREPIPL